MIPDPSEPENHGPDYGALCVALWIALALALLLMYSGGGKCP